MILYNGIEVTLEQLEEIERLEALANPCKRDLRVSDSYIKDLERQVTKQRLVVDQATSGLHNLIDRLNAAIWLQQKQGKR